MSRAARFCWGFSVSHLSPGRTRATQKGRRGLGGKKLPPTRPSPSTLVQEPEAGRTVDSQMNNLLSGVGPHPLRTRHATNDRVGACGTKLHERVQFEHQWRAGLSLPFRFALNQPQRPELRKRRKVSFAIGSATVVGKLLRSWTQNVLKLRELSISSLFRRCSTSEVV